MTPTRFTPPRLFFVVIVLLVAGCAGLYFSGWLHDAKMEESKVLEVVGLFISVLSFLFACYFAVAAVTAYSHIRDIEGLALNVKHLHQEAQQEFVALRSTVADAKGHGDAFLKYIYDTGSVIQDFMKSVDTESGEHIRALHLSTKRYMFSYANTDTQKLDAARELVELGTDQDLEAVEPYLALSQNPDARALLRVLWTKLHERSQRENSRAGKSA